MIRGLKQALRLGLKGLPVSQGTSRTLHTLALKARSLLASSVLQKLQMGHFLPTLRMRATEEHHLAHVRRRSQGPVPGVFPNPPCYSSHLQAHSVFPTTSMVLALSPPGPWHLLCSFSRNRSLTPNSSSSLSVTVWSHSAKQGRLPCPSHLSHGPHHTLQESMACVPYSSLDSKASTAPPHPGFPASAEGRDSRKYPEPPRLHAPTKLSLHQGVGISILGPGYKVSALQDHPASNPLSSLSPIKEKLDPQDFIKRGTQAAQQGGT